MASSSGAAETLRALLDVDCVQAASTAAVLGLVFHHTVLRTVEVELYMYTLVGLGLITILALFAVHIFAGLAPLSALARVALLSTSFNTAVFLSIGVYRVFFHRLRRFPGPAPAKVSRFWSAYKASRDLQYFKLVSQWNKQYGDFIRTGEYSIESSLLYHH